MLKSLVVWGFKTNFSIHFIVGLIDLVHTPYHFKKGVDHRVTHFTIILVPFWNKNQACWCLTFPTMLPTVMMDPLGAPQATRAWATACVTKKEPWKKHKGKGKKMQTGWTYEKTASYISTDHIYCIMIIRTIYFSLHNVRAVYSRILPSKELFSQKHPKVRSYEGLVALWKVRTYPCIYSFSISTHGRWGLESNSAPIGQSPGTAWKPEPSCLWGDRAIWSI